MHDGLRKRLWVVHQVLPAKVLGKVDDLGDDND